VRPYDSVITPAWYQYYTQYPNGDHLGGTDDFADYCGFYRYQSNYRGDCTIAEFNTPGDTDSYYINNHGEVYCPSCRCVTAAAPPVGEEGSNVVGPSCQNFTCVNNLLKMKIANQWHDCPTNGKTIEITAYDGSYNCPSNVAAVCSVSPTYDSWPEFVSVSPGSGEVGTSVTVVGSGFGTATIDAVYFGEDYGCTADSMSVSNVNGEATITCEIGERPKAFPIREDTDVDVVIVDSYGRTASGTAEFTLSDAFTLISSPLTLLFFIVVAIVGSF